MMGAGETLIIERHGQPIGFFVPVAAKDRRAGHEALGRLGAAVAAISAATGLSEDELDETLARGRPRR